MRLVLLRARNASPYYDPEIQEPLGLQCLSAYARERGDAVLLLDGALDRLSDVMLARRAVSFAPDAIGISMTTAQEIVSVRAVYAEATRRLGEGGGRRVVWIAGGNFVTSEPETALRELPEEMLLGRFEGETIVEEVARRVAGERGREALAGRVICGAPVADLDALPLADRPYAAQVTGTGWAFNLQGSRGCCGNCRYCSSPGMTAPGMQRWRGFSMGRILAEIENLCRNYGAESFNFVDEDFLGPNHLAQQRAAELAEGLARLERRVSFGIQVRPDSLSIEIIEQLARAGLTYVFVGIESSEPEDLRRWGRPWKVEPWPLVKRLRECGAEVNAGVMMWHPDATLGSIRRCARKLQEYGLLEYRSAINRLDAMPGSAMYTAAAAAGKLDPQMAGPQALPYEHTGIEALHNDVLEALAPLGPPSMQALCAVPPLVARRYLAAASPAAWGALQEILARQNTAVAESFFALLDAHEARADARELVGKLRERNFAVAMETTQALVTCGLAPSLEALREAIRIDAGM